MLYRKIETVIEAFVVSNERQITTVGKITYIPVYDVMFFQNQIVGDPESLKF